MMETKLDNIQKSINEIKIDLARLIQRTEHYVERIDKIEEELKPIQTHVNRVTGVFIFLAAGGLTTLLTLLKYLW